MHQPALELICILQQCNANIIGGMLLAPASRFKKSDMCVQVSTRPTHQWQSVSLKVADLNSGYFVKQVFCQNTTQCLRVFLPLVDGVTLIGRHGIAPVAALGGELINVGVIFYRRRRNGREKSAVIAQD